MSANWSHYVSDKCTLNKISWVPPHSSAWSVQINNSTDRLENKLEKYLYPSDLVQNGLDSHFVIFPDQWMMYSCIIQELLWKQSLNQGSTVPCCYKRKKLHRVSLGAYASFNLLLWYSGEEEVVGRALTMLNTSSLAPVLSNWESNNCCCCFLLQLQIKAVKGMFLRSAPLFTFSNYIALVRI